MNDIRHLTGFFNRAAKDYHLNATHISMYVAIFQLWNLHRFKNPVSLSRSKVMELSKVGFKTTYHKCMKELQQYGYLQYDQFYHQLRGSLLYLFDWANEYSKSKSIDWTGTGLALDQLKTSTGLVSDQWSSESLSGKGFQSPLNIYKHYKHIKLSLFESNPNVEKLKKEKDEIFFKGIICQKGLNIFLPGKFPLCPTCIWFRGQKNKAVEKKNIAEKIPGKSDPVIKFFLEYGYPESQAITFFTTMSLPAGKLVASLVQKVAFSGS